MGRRRRAFERVAERFEAAWSQGLLFIPETNADAVALSRMVKQNLMMRPHRGIYCSVSKWAEIKPDERARRLVRTLARLHPDWVFDAYSALVLQGFPVSYHLLSRIYIAIDPCKPSSVGKGIVPVERRDALIEEIDGVRVVSLVDAALACLRLASFEDGLAIADALIRREEVSRGTLMDWIHHAMDHDSGMEHALSTARFADPRSESGGESMARAMMVAAGVLPTDLQVEFTDPVNVGHIIRVDYLFRRVDGCVMVGEFDGKIKYLDHGISHGSSAVDVMLRERQRESHLTLLGMPVIRFCMKDIRTPGRIARMLADVGITQDTLVETTYLDTTPRT